MRNALRTFDDNISDARALFSYYEYLGNEVKVPQDKIADFLRFQLVYAVSALDRFLHEIIRIGCIETLSGLRLVTSKFSTLSINLANEMKLFTRVDILSDVSFLRSEFVKIASSEISRLFAYMSFQDPEKVKDGLSYIWNEKQKFEKLATIMSMDRCYVEQTLKVIVNRRNQIAHEADVDPLLLQKRIITVSETNAVLSFISSFAHAVYTAVTEKECYVPK